MKVRIPERPKDRPYVIDTFMFHNEEELLDLRLRELDSAVDIFVMVQANRTHVGTPREHRPIVRDRLINLSVDLPEHTETPMHREIMHRNAIRGGVDMIGLEPDDIIMVSDLDEIPNKAAMDNIIDFALSGEVVVCNQMLSYFKLDLVDSEPWYGTTIMSAQSLSRNLPSDCRCVFRPNYRRVIENGGWHFAWMGGNDAIRAKLSSYMHTECNTEEFRSDAALDKALRERVTLHNGHKLTPVPLSYLPGEVRNNRERYAHLMLENP